MFETDYLFTPVCSTVLGQQK